MSKVISEPITFSFKTQSVQLNRISQTELRGSGGLRQRHEITLLTHAADRTAPAHSPSFWSRFSTSRHGPAPPLCYHPGGAVSQGGQEVADALWEQEAQVVAEGEKMQCLKDTGLVPAPWTPPMDLAQSI